MSRGQPPNGFVASAEGTEIAYWRHGKGPVLLIVHGGGNFSGAWSPMLPLLTPTSTVVVIDRRGRGSSGDTLPYTIEREVEDVAAVANALGPMCVLGHSFGGPLALEAALSTGAISSLIVYEGWPDPGDDLTVLPDFLAPMEGLIGEGRYEESVEYGETPEDIAKLRRDPLWPDWVDATATFPREVRAYLSFWIANPPSGGRWRGLAIPTLLLYGEANPAAGDGARVLANSLDDARIEELPGQGHRAYSEAPDVLAAAIMPFLRVSGS
jgi:pimeloyl-ACP methyl ester carboxylesterase